MLGPILLKVYRLLGPQLENVIKPEVKPRATLLYFALSLTVLGLVIPYFNGQSYIAYPSLINAFAMTLLYLEIRPASSEGLVFFNQQLSGPDFISVSLLSGRVVFRYSLGPESSLSLESDVALALDQWHSIEVSRTGSSGRLIVDNTLPITGSSTGSFTSLQLGDNLFLGGVPNSHSIALSTGTTVGFNGCIRNVFTGSSLEPLDLLADAVFGSEVTECSISPCERYSCSNGGTCMETGADTFMCVCPIGFTGSLCDTSVCEISNPCQNNGACVVETVNGTDELQCDCSLPYAGGAFCTESKFALFLSSKIKHYIAISSLCRSFFH